MTSRQGEAAKLAGRVRRVGWPVVYGRDGWRVTCPDGVAIVIHKTFSDRNAIEACERNLNLHGFDVAEKKVKNAEERRRLQRIADDRAENERAIAATVKRAKILNVAAGIYGMDEVDINWLMQPHPAPVCRKVMMTPEMAEKLLTLNQHNRPRKPVQIARLVRHIENGTWMLTHQGVALDTRPFLQDGQNRLEAISIAGTPVPIYVFVGMDPGAFPVIDTHVVRSTADTLALEGVENHTAVAAMLRLVHLYDESAEWLTWNKFQLDNSNAIKMFNANKDLAVRAFLDGGRIASRSGARTPRAPAMAGLYLIRRAQGKTALVHPVVEEFVEGLTTGADMKAGDIRITYRRVMANFAELRGRRHSGEHLGLLIKAWNTFATGQQRSLLAFRKDELMPRPVIVDNGR